MRELGCQPSGWPGLVGRETPFWLAAAQQEQPEADSKSGSKIAPGVALAPAYELAEEWKRDRPAGQLGNVARQVGLVHGWQAVVLVYGHNPIAPGHEALIIACDYPMADDGWLTSRAKNDNVPNL